MTGFPKQELLNLTPKVEEGLVLLSEFLFPEELAELVPLRRLLMPYFIMAKLFNRRMTSERPLPLSYLLKSHW